MVLTCFSESLDLLARSGVGVEAGKEFDALWLNGADGFSTSVQERLGHGGLVG